MRKKLIAVDVDDVLGDSTSGWIQYTNKTWGMNLTNEDYDEDWYKMWGVDNEEGSRRAFQMYESGVVEELVADPQAVRVLRKLSASYDLLVLTSRHKNLQPATERWIADNFGGIFINVHMAGIYDNHDADAIHRTKGDVLKTLGADYHIDDHPKHCLAAAEQGIQAIMFGDYKWNRDIDLPAGVIRCKDWLAIEAYFDGQS